MPCEMMRAYRVLTPLSILLSDLPCWPEVGPSMQLDALTVLEVAEALAAVVVEAVEGGEH